MSEQKRSNNDLYNEYMAMQLDAINKHPNDSETIFPAEWIRNAQRITQYYIASGPTKEMLGVRVSNRIKQGWTPLGGVSIGATGRCFQAMVKYE